ncbi:uncharacterized protein BDW47DRAFT_99256 [Aspergillus candidus]|uniref:Uncharacterized protein n=1 Tax=Aspergillus candidus TaxID=41067 RepID=A0A2I2FLN6_ASPCN|nr:hypothetical protein BDW47DRAFT_99256 [Aspergillus candidus]PLB41545.1 hypothetical protein BDW47DRAFT_99256 [Aspergillus candidus]
MSRNRRAPKPSTPRIPNTPRATNTQREQLEPSSVAKRPRTPMTWKRWNHRRDRQVLLAIFAQTNMKVPNFKELSEILGGEEYSVDMLRRRFIYLCEMAEEYREERQEVAAEMGNMSPKIESDEDDDQLDDEEFEDDVVIVGETTSPQADTPLPYRQQNPNPNRNPLGRPNRTARQPPITPTGPSRFTQNAQVRGPTQPPQGRQRNNVQRNWNHGAPNRPPRASISTNVHYVESPQYAVEVNHHPSHRYF